MESTILKNLGLNQNEVTVYLTLLREGKQKAREIIKKTSLTRGLLYKALQDLEDKQIIIREDEENAVSEFSAIHPNVLQGLVEQKIKKVIELKQSLSVELGNFTSLYNLGNNKPGMEFYEGVEGLKKVLEDTLKDNPEKIIYTYADSKSIQKEIIEIDKKYIKKRLQQKIRKKILLVDSAPAKKHKKDITDKLTKIRLVKTKGVLPELYSFVQIYNNKVAFVSYENNTIVSTIISNPQLYKLQKFFFKSLWNKLEPITN